MNASLKYILALFITQLHIKPIAELEIYVITQREIQLIVIILYGSPCVIKNNGRTNHGSIRFSGVITSLTNISRHLFL